MGKPTGALVFTVGADTRPLGRNLKKARGMLTGFGAGIGRVGAGLGKVGLGAGLALGGAILAARGAFRALMKLAPYSDDLASAMGELLNINEDLKKRVAEALAPAVTELANAMSSAAPMIAEAAVAMTEGVAEYMRGANKLSRPGDGNWFFDTLTTALSGTWSRQFMGESDVADQTRREFEMTSPLVNMLFGGPGNPRSVESLAAGKAGSDQLGAGARGEGNAGDYLRRIAENTQPFAEGF